MPQIPLPRIAALGALLFFLLSQSVFAQDRFTRQVNFDIAAQTVESALIEFSKQADVQVMVGTSSLNGQRTDGVKGKLSVAAALEQLLRNTGLEYQAKGNTITVRSTKNARADAIVVPLVKGTRTASRDPAGEVSASDPTPQGDKTEFDTETLDEIVVTGTHIRGASSGTPLLTFTSLDLQRTGYLAPQDWIESLPQNFGGGPSEESGGAGNFNRGSGVNLRGLGTGATLVLVNGRRQPMSGQNADFVDLSSIPASAIDRVEVLTDGASALYGSDAIGGVVNILLRRDFDGAETRVRFATADGGVDEKAVSQLLGHSWTNGFVLLDYQYYDRDSLLWDDRGFSSNADKTGRGGSDFRSIESNPGNILDPSTFAPAFAIPRGQDGRSLTPSDLLAGVVNLENLSSGASLLPERRMNSVYVTGGQSIGPNFEFFADARYSERDMAYFFPAEHSFLFVPSSNAFFVDPFGGSPGLFVEYNFIDDFGPIKTTGQTKTYLATAGVTGHVARDWRVIGAVSYGEEKLAFESSFIDQVALGAALADSNPATAFNPFGDGSNTPRATLDSIRAPQSERGVTDILNPNVVADGPLFAMAGGLAKLAVGLDYRSEHLDRESDSLRLHFGRQINAAFAELALPLVGGANAMPGIHRLEVTAAGRYESYSDFGETFNPKLTLRYAPLAAVQLRAAWGTSFRAPVLFDLESRSPLFNSARLVPVFPDPLNGASPVLFRFGGNSQLKEETATNLSFGVDFKPSQDVSLSGTYFKVEYDDRIATPGPANVFDVLFQAEQWGSIIARSPTQSQVQEVCNDPVFVGSREACLASTPAAIVDFRKRNIASTRVDGLDLIINADLPTSFGKFGFDLNSTYILTYEVAASDRSPFVDVVDTSGNPVSLRARATTSWQNNGYSASISLNHVSDYRDNSRPTITRNVDAWNTVDLRMSYTTKLGSGWMNGLEVALSAVNVFDEDPPFVNQETGYDPFNATPLGRFCALSINKTW